MCSVKRLLLFPAVIVMKKCSNDEWPVCEITEEEIMEMLGGEEDVTWQYFDCDVVHIPYLNTSVGCGRGRKDAWWKRRIGQGVFSQEVTSVPCSDCHEEMFQWSSWSTVDNKRTRMRGSNEVPHSYQEEE